MGRRGRGSTLNAFEQRRQQHRSLMSAIHRARVTDIHIERGTVSVEFEKLHYAREVVIPLMSLSVPRAAKDDASGKRETQESNAAWGRFIPQVGDLLLVGFDTDGSCYSLGYHAVNYQGFTRFDDNREDRGGIGWGNASGKRIKPGDWDFRSSRNSSLYMGDKLKLSSGPFSLTLDKPQGRITTVGNLLSDRYGVSEQRLGDVYRFVLPTDATETAIPSLLDPTQTAQECTNIVKRGSTAIPGGFEMIRTSLGEVVDELTYTPMIPSKAVPGLTGTSVRKLCAVKDPTASTDLYTDAIDDLGGFGVNAPTAPMVVFQTAAATWQVTNTMTSWTSTGTFTVISPAITLQATASITLDSALVQLGGLGAVSPVIKGTEFSTSLSTFLGAISAATKSVTSAPTPITNAAALAAIGVAADAFLATIANFLSTKVMTE